MRVFFWIGVGCLVILSGCSQRVRPVNTNYEPYVFKPSATSATMTLEAAANICKSVFPESYGARDDGDKNFSISNSVNVALETPAGSFICSVDASTGRVDRVHDGRRAYSGDEYEHIFARKQIAEEMRRRRMEEIQEDARRIAKGETAAFVKKAKRAVSDIFKDPDSAKFRDMYLSNREVPTLCGEVNAKNSYGGYVGYKRFYYNGLTTHVDGSGEPSESNLHAAAQENYCNAKFADID